MKNIFHWFVVYLFCILSVFGSRHDATAQTSPPNPFSMGVYIYQYQMAAAAAEQGKDYSTFFDDHLKILQQHGVNAIHLGGVGTSQAQFDEHLRLAKKHNMKLLPQLDFAYFQPSWSDTQMNANAQNAANFINQYNDDSAIMAWSVKEEVAASDVNRLGQYYTKIREYAPDANFALVHNDLAAAQAQPVPNPLISGADRYAFWWDTSAGGYLASPAFALNWTRTQAAAYYTESAQRDSDFMLVTTQGGYFRPSWANQVANDTSNPTLMNKVRQWAADGRMGWKVYHTDEGDRYNVWKYYRTPGNCTKATAWIGVLEGAKHYFNWHYDPRSCDTDIEQSALQATPPDGVNWMTLAGRPGMDNPQLEEFNEASQEIRQYERIITNMTKLATSPVLIQEASTNFYCNAFSYPELDGKVIVVQNSNVGTWPANSKYFFSETDPIYINDEGNLVGYTPFEEPMSVQIAFYSLSSMTGVYDIASGQEIIGVGSGLDKTFETWILPGSGKLLFLGSPEEMQILHGMMGTVPEPHSLAILAGAIPLLWFYGRHVSRSGPVAIRGKSPLSPDVQRNMPFVFGRLLPFYDTTPAEGNAIVGTVQKTI